MKTLVKTLTFSILVCLLVSNAYGGFTYSFINITGNSATNAAIGEAQLFMEVSEYDTDQVLFTFSNIGPYDSTVSEVFFDDPLEIFSGIDSLITADITKVNFTSAEDTGNLPGGSTIVPPFAKPADYDVSAVPPPAKNGIDPGEELGVVFDLAEGATYNDLISDIDEGIFRVGLHVISFPDGGSEAFVNNGRTPPPPVIPAPGAVSLGLLGTFVVGYIRKRRNG